MSNLTNNTSDLRSILAAVNALPEAGETPAAPVLQEKSNITPTKSQQTITPDSGYDGLSKVVVNKIPDEYVIPSGTKEIAANGSGIDVSSYAKVNVNVPTGGGGGGGGSYDPFLNGTLTSLDSSVTTVVDYCCRGQSKLTSVNLPNVKSIGSNVFYGCGALASIQAPVATSIGSYCFMNCSSLQEVNFPLVTSLSTGMFQRCTGLKKADLGAVKSTSSTAFQVCSALETVIFRRADAIVPLANVNIFASSGVEAGTGYVYVPRALVDTYKAATNWSTYANQIRAIEDYPAITGG